MAKKKDIPKKTTGDKSTVVTPRAALLGSGRKGQMHFPMLQGFSEGKLFLVACLILGSFSVIFFSGHLFGTSYFWSTYWSDWTEQNIPFLKINIEAFRNHEIPAWNPYTYGGTPHLADPSTQYYYPLNFILYLFSDTASLFKSLTYFIILHYLIASIGVYLLAKSIKIEFWGRILAAVAYTFSCSLICRWQFVPVIYALAWVPFIFYAFISLYKSGNILFIPIATIITSILFLTGQPQFFFYQFLLLGILIFILMAFDLVNKEISLKMALLNILLLAIPLLLGVAICAIQIFHTLEYIPLTQRADITFDYATDASLQFQQLKSIIHPYLFGYFKGANQLEFTPYFLTANKSYHYWETAFFFGISTFILGIFAAASRIKQPLTIAFIVIIIFCIAHAMGSNSAFYKILFQLPGFDSFRMPARILPFAVLCFCLLAGFAIQETTEKNRIKNIVLPVIVLFTLLLAISTPGNIVTKFNLAGYNADLILSIKNKAGIIILICALLLSMAYFKIINRHLVSIALILLLFYELISVNKNYITTNTPPESSYTIDANNAEMLKLNKDAFYRYTPNDIRMRIMRRNQSVLHGISSMDGFYALTYDKKILPSLPFNKLMGVKYLSVPYARNPDGSLAYRLDSTAYYPHERMTFRNTYLDTALIATTQLDSFDYINNTIITEASDTGIIMDNIDENAASFSSNLTDYSYSKQAYQVETSNNGLLVLGEYYYPAWQAYVDGKKTPVIMANRLLTSIPLTKGKHTVILRYESAGYQKGKMATYFSLVLLLLVSVLSISFHKKFNHFFTSKIN